MNEFNLINVIKEIETFEINLDNIIDFILQPKTRNNDLAFFFYKSSVLQLLQTQNHLDQMIAFYYKVESPYLILDKISYIYKNFLEGNNDILKKIFTLAKKLTIEFSNLKDQENILNIIKELDSLIEYKCIEQENLKESTEEIETKRLKLNIKNTDIKITKKRELLETIFRNNKAKTLLEIMDFKEDDNLDWDQICERFELRFIACYNFIKHYKQLKEDLLIITSVTKNYSKIVDTIIKTNDLEQVCIIIRKTIFPTKEYIYRNKSLIGNNFMKYTSKPENIIKDYNSLKQQFKDILQEQDIELFLRKCADFHFDFLLVHPYDDGNGRTARILFTTILLTKNIMLPALYYDINTKNDLYLGSNQALSGDYRNIEQFIFERLAHYYPIIIPAIPQKSKKKIK